MLGETETFKHISANKLILSGQVNNHWIFTTIIVDCIDSVLNCPFLLFVWNIYISIFGYLIKVKILFQKNVPLRRTITINNHEIVWVALSKYRVETELEYEWNLETETVNNNTHRNFWASFNILVKFFDDCIVLWFKFTLVFVNMPINHKIELDELTAILSRLG